MVLRSRWIVVIVSAGKSISHATFARNGFSALEHHLILHSLGKVTEAKLEEVLKRAREFFVE